MKLIKKRWPYFSISLIIVIIIAAVFITKTMMLSSAPESTPTADTAISSPPAGMSPVETVQYYFSELNKKNQTNFESVVYEKQRGAQYDLANLNYVKLISCEENNSKTEQASFNNSWYPDPYATSVLDVEFDINYKNGGGGGFTTGKYTWHFWLVKKDENSDWMIVMWGMP